MRVSTVGDIDAGTGVSHVIDALNRCMRPRFATLDYGGGLSALCLCLVCIDPRRVVPKRRERLVRKGRTLYLDVMLEFDVLADASPETRLRIVREQALHDVSACLTRRALPEFDRVRFLDDFAAALGELDRHYLLEGDVVPGHVPRPQSPRRVD
jgi:hypothetical protein